MVKSAIMIVNVQNKPFFIKNRRNQTSKMFSFVTRSHPIIAITFYDVLTHPISK